LPIADEQTTSMTISEQEQRRRQEWVQQAFARHTLDFPVQLNFPAKLVSANDDDTKKQLRTDSTFLQYRLLEAGLPFVGSGEECPQTLQQTVQKLEKVVHQLQHSGCYDSVNVEIDRSSGEDLTSGAAILDLHDHDHDHGHDGPRATQQLNIHLKEKNWYRLYVGGGIRNDLKSDTLGGAGGGGFVETLRSQTQFETTAGLNNLTGCLDTTSLQYSVDATSQSRWDFHHVRPLDAFSFTKALPNISSYSISLRGALDTLDYEWTRSYKERQRRVAIRLSNSLAHNAEMADQPYYGLEWSWLFRDILPRRHPTLPYALDASPEICHQAGPSEKHALTWEYRTNGAFCDSKLNPSQGIDWYTKLELAGPPGDVGFAKTQLGGALHTRIINAASLSCSLHTSFHIGFLEAMAFGGSCPKPPTVSDRFFVGGPLQLRGFSSAGIGPRATKGSTTAPQGDALGGEFFYTATLAASMTTASLDAYNIRLFGFGNVGTLAGSLKSNWRTIAQSSRASVGIGATVALPMGRIEATYSKPLRYGPRDARQPLQFGLGFSFG
jgi:Omp85 superfamily domain